MTSSLLPSDGAIQRQPEQRRLYQQIADQIRHLVRQDGLAPGSRLPSERDLALHLGVSRPSLREALIALEIEGAVEIRVGSGIYVLAERAPQATMRPMGDSPSDLMLARMTIEGSVALLAAARITEEALTTLGSALDAMTAGIEAGHSPVEHDRLFHTTVAAQCGNAVLARIVGELFDGRHSPLSEKMQDRFGTFESWRLALAEHRSVLSALELRDGLLAEASMRTHLEASRRRWIGP